MDSSALRDRRILVVEDEYLIAITLSDQLEGVGSIVTGPVLSVKQAMKTIESDPEIDAAILDINLGGVMALPDRRRASGAEHSVRLYVWL